MDKTMIYVLKAEDTKGNALTFSDNEFIEAAKKQGKAYSLKEFEKAFNEVYIDTETDYIRCIENEKIKIYKIYDRDCEEITGEGELCEFAEREVLSNPDSYIEENITEYYGDKEEINKIMEIVNKIVIGEGIKTVEEAKLILAVRDYGIEEIELH